MTWLKRLIAAGLLTLAGAANAVVPALCTGSLFNPVTDADWNTVFPITIAGVPITSGSNLPTPLMAVMPPICVCPTVLGIPFVGIGVTYWQPLYLSEIERRPGCLSSLGGINVLPGFQLLSSEQAQNHSETGKGTNRMQVHWYSYPVFQMLDFMKTVACKSASGFNLGYMTELDPIWQDDFWSNVFSPEGALFSNPIATAACAVDAVASTLASPMDALFWCAGTWGNVYPMAGNSNHSGDAFKLNNQIQAKFLARNHRMGLQWQTVGPTAICFSHPAPIWIKSQYRMNQVAPIARKGRAVPTGSSPLFQFPPITNLPTQEHTVNLIWQGQQCCLKPIP